MGGRGNNQFFRHENSLCGTPAWPEFTAGRIAASICPPGARKTGTAPETAGKHVARTCNEVAWRSKPEGRNILSLSRLIRCRKPAGQTADDAVLTLKILLSLTPALPGSTTQSFLPVHSDEADMSPGLTAG